MAGVSIPILLSGRIGMEEGFPHWEHDSIYLSPAKDAPDTLPPWASFPLPS